MGNLFFPDNSSLEELLVKLAKPSPQFILWVRAILKQEDGTQTLENILNELVRTDHVNNRLDGLEYINNISLEHSDTNLTIACADMLGKSHREPIRLLNRLLHKQTEQINELGLFRFYGTVSHQAIYDFATGKIPNYNSIQKLFALNQGPGLVFRDNLLEKRQTHVQNLLFETQEIFPEMKYLQEILPNNQVSAKLKSEIAYFWNETAQKIQQSSDWVSAYAKAKPIIHEIRDRLFVIFGPYMNMLRRGWGVYTDYLFILTILSWATILKNGSEKRILFRELPVLCPAYGYSGGRIDALELVSIDGQKPTGWQAETIKQMSEIRFNSVGRVIAELECKFGKNLTFRIIDWKFSVGDGIGQGKILEATDIVKPLTQHLEQVKRYIALANLDYYLTKFEIGENIWSKQSPVKSGRLEYILATSDPVIHEIKMTPSEQEFQFQNNLVFNLQQSRQLARIRRLNNLVIGQLVNGLKGKKQIKTSQNKPGPNKKQLSLTIKPTINGVETVISKYRHFLDKDKIIEQARDKNGKSILLMHLDKLGTVLPDTKTSMFIKCLLHDERTPSLHIDLNRGLWKCFGCGAYGFFAEGSFVAQHEQDFKINFTRTTPNEFKRTGKISIPEEHHNIMVLAQDVLSSQFQNGPAQTYVKKRCIDPELAHEFGAGYGNEELISVLLDKYDYDLLIYYGFVAISNRVTSQRGICPLLLKRGRNLSQIKREIKGRLSTTWGFPYSTLHDRVTFPLTLENRNTSFYGRAIWPNCSERSKHRKLTREYTMIPHGSFNTWVLRSTFEEISVTEGAFDALSLMQMGHKATMAIIGVDNSVILESIARSDKNLAIAFDVDKNTYQTGQTNTAKIIARLQKMNYRGQLRNFTQDFIAENQDFVELGCKDFNEYLMHKTKTA